MSRIQPVTEEQKVGKTKELLEVIQKKMGRVPNMLATLANSPASLEAYLNFSGALHGGKLSAKERESLAIAVGAKNECAYCVSAHSAIGKMTGLTEEEVSKNKEIDSNSTRTLTILKLAELIVEKKGHLTDQEVTSAKSNGLTDEEILEVVANTSLNIYTNYINHIADPVIDF